MNLDLTEDQQLLAKVAGDFLVRECPPSLVRELRAAGRAHAPELWAKLADLGWLGLAIDQERGGGGSTLVDLGLFSEQAGRVLLPSSYAATMFAALVVEALATDEQRRELLGAIAAGDLVATVAVAEAGAVRDPRCFTTEARREGDGWVVQGEKRFVPAAGEAGVLLVVARQAGTQGGVVVLAVPRAAGGVDLEAQATFGHDGQAIVRLTDVAVPASAALGADAWAGFDGAALAATALLCMEMVGGMHRVLDMTAAYVKERHQFGRPIGTFQAVQHHVADMATRVEAARWASYQAVWRLAEGLEARREVAIAKAWCAHAYPWVTQTAHQLHGGAGIVLDHDLHLWSERAKAAQVAFGGRDVQLRQLAGAMGWR